MTTARQILATLLAFTTLAGSAFAGQDRHIVSPSQVSVTVTDHVAAQDADRSAVRDALARPEVKNVAAMMGADMDRLNAAAAVMTGSDLAQAASAARQVNEQLVGGASTVVISTTTIIIILLVLILLIVALK